MQIVFNQLYGGIWKNRNVLKSWLWLLTVRWYHPRCSNKLWGQPWLAQPNIKLQVGFMFHVTANTRQSSKATVLLPSCAPYLVIRELHVNCQQKGKLLKLSLHVTIFVQCSLVLSNYVTEALQHSGHVVIICQDTFKLIRNLFVELWHSPGPGSCLWMAQRTWQSPMGFSTPPFLPILPRTEYSGLFIDTFLHTKYFE